MGRNDEKRAWVTLLTRSSYLPGVITLAYTLRQHITQYPLIVLITPSLPQSALRALELEAKFNDQIIIKRVEPLLPSGSVTLIAARFEDTWTKLRAFELIPYETCIFLDADITIYKNMDEVFDTKLPDYKTWIAANHACVCNLDHDSWAPDNWKVENCAWTSLEHPKSLTSATPVPTTQAPPHTHCLLNGGLFLYHPSEELWTSMLDHFHTSPKLSSYQFPDQDFMADYFHNRWLPLPWRYNALKTMKQWHTNIWRDTEVCGLHYIVDKPWEKRIASDGVAGHLGRDGITHSWWWEVWDHWRTERLEAKAQDAMNLVKIIEENVTESLDEEGDRKQCAENKKKRLPILVPDSAANKFKAGDANPWSDFRNLRSNEKSEFVHSPKYSKEVSRYPTDHGPIPQQ